MEIEIAPWLMITIRWGVGFAFAVGVGFLGVRRFLRQLRKYIGYNPPDVAPDTPGVPDWLVGVMERSFFTVAVGMNIQGYLIAMGAWLALKMASNWHLQYVEDDPAERARKIRYGMTALVAGLLSMAFALAGGLVASNQWWPF